MHFIFPSSCPVCGKLGTSGSEDCFSYLVKPLIPRCPVCGKPFPCSNHKNTFPLISGNHHEGLNRLLILELKYGNNSGLGRIMGRTLARQIAKFPDCRIIPVPLHRKSRRNYNQAKLIANGISDIWEQPVLDILSWRSDIPSQVSRSPLERKTLSYQSLSCSAHDLKDEKFVLVDDVSTTGTTLDVCRKAVSIAGGRIAGAVTWTVSAY